MNEQSRNADGWRAARGIAFAFCVALVTASCRSDPPPPPPPVELHSVVDYYPGTPLTGSNGRMPENLDPEGVLEVRLEIFGIDHQPDLELNPLAERIYLVTSAGSGDAVLPVSSALANARLGSGEAAAILRDRLVNGELPGVRLVSRRVGVVPRGVTLHFDLSGRSAVEAAADGHRPTESLELHLFRDADSEDSTAKRDPHSVGVAVVTERLVDEDGPADGRVSRREAGLLDILPTPTSPLGIFLPSPIPNTGFVTFVLCVTVEPSEHRDPAVRARLVEACRRALEARCRRDAEPLPAVFGQTQGGDLRLALEALATREHRRKSLVYLSRALEADLALEISFLASDEVVQALAEAVHARVNADARPGGRVSSAIMANLDWILQQEGARVLVAQLVKERDATPAAGLAVRYAGEVGRRPDLLRVIANEAAGRNEFAADLVEANEAFLDDTSPAARVRAHDWLERRGVVVEGYDPLARGVERRAMLERHETRREAEREAERKAERKAERDAARKAKANRRGEAGAGEGGKRP